MLLYFLEDNPTPSSPYLTIFNKTWSLRLQEYNDSDNEASSFTCISYTWGPIKVPSPLHDSFMISDRTVPALIAAINARPNCTRFWIDAFCVPHSSEERKLTLASMGFIYARATEVIVVLSPNAQPAINQMQTSDRIDTSAIESLEQEEWVSRAWTYQEVVNSRSMCFTCYTAEDARPIDKRHKSGSTPIPGPHFLNCVGYSLSRLPSSINRRRKYPHLDAFEDVILDWMTAGFQERSALQVMANMHRRTQQRDEDHFYAMISVVSTELPSLDETGNACEEFMTDCEKKGDYSFIFSTEAREKHGKRKWRPVSTGILPPILPWTVFGARQPGHWEDDKFWLDHVVVVELGDPNEEVLQFMRKLLFGGSDSGDRSVQHATYEYLKGRDFEGAPQCISTTSGYCFPSRPVLSPESVTVIVSATLSWPFGAPALVRDEHDGDAAYTTGAFIGRITSEATTVMLS